MQKILVKVIRIWLDMLQIPITREGFVKMFCYTVDVKKNQVEEALDSILEYETYPNLIIEELEPA